MELSTYGKFIDETADYHRANTGSILEHAYVALGLSGESGEVADLIKKVMRNPTADFSEELKAREQEIFLELGDTFWYLIRFIQVMGFTPEAVMRGNVSKLCTRHGYDPDKWLAELPNAPNVPVPIGPLGSVAESSLQCSKD